MSKTIKNADELAKKEALLQSKFEFEKSIDMPASFVGWRLVPQSFEFIDDSETILFDRTWQTKSIKNNEY